MASAVPPPEQASCTCTISDIIVTMTDVRSVRGPVRILAIDTHWSSARGGVSTINRALCLALADAGADVYCLVGEAEPDEIATARDRGVKLVVAKRGPGWTVTERLLRRPTLPEDWQPQLIIGHGRPTGRIAEAQRDERFGPAVHFHVVHTEPDRIGGNRAEIKWDEEFPVLVKADRVLAVGPRLWRRAQSDLHGRGAPVPIKIDPGFDLIGEPAKCPPRDGAHLVLVAGRLEDAEVKGLDLAAKAVAEGINQCAGDTRGVALRLRGVPEHGRARLQEKVKQWTGQDLPLDLRRFSPTAADLRDDIRRSVLVLMPSYAEGFGLVGQEAIIEGVPVLVSERSGLADLLCDEEKELARGVVLPVHRDEKDGEIWGRAVAAVLDDPGGAFAQAAKLRQRMSRKRSWAAVVERVLQAWAVSPRRRGGDPAVVTPSRTALLCADGPAGQAFLDRTFPVLRDMVDCVDPDIVHYLAGPPTSGPAASPDVVLCALGEDNESGRPAGLTEILASARHFQRPVVVLQVSPGATLPDGLPASHTIDVTGDFLDALAELSGHLAGFDASRSGAARREPEPIRSEPVETHRRPVRPRFLPINEMPATASAGFHDRAPLMAAVLSGLTGERYRLVVLAGQQDGVGKTAVVRAIRDDQEAAEEPSLRSLVYFSTRGYRWISAPAILADLTGLAEEADREPLLTEVRAAPWRSVVDKVLSKLGTIPIGVVIDDADRLFDAEGNWTDLDLRDLIDYLMDKDGHPVSVLMLVRQAPAALNTRRLHRRTLSISLDDGLPFENAESLLRALDDERGTLGLAGASTAQLERLYLGTGGLPRSLELVAGLLSMDHTETVDHVADLLDEAADGPSALFTEIFGRLDLPDRRVLQALAILTRPVTAEAVEALLAEVYPELRAGASLQLLRRCRVIHTYGDRYYLSGAQAEYALSTLPTEESAGPASSLTKEHLRRRGVAYFRSQRLTEQAIRAIADLWPQFGEIELLMRTGDGDAALTLMNEVDDAYLTGWGQSHALLSWREELRRSLQDPESLACNLSYLRAALRQYEGDTRGREDLMEVFNRAESLDDPRNVIVASVQLANVLADNGELDEAIRRLEAAAEQARSYGHLGLEVDARTGLFTCLAKHGEFHRAEDEMAKIDRVNDRIGSSERRASQLVNQAWLGNLRGDHRTAHRLLLRAQVLVEGSCSDARRAWVLGGLAATALAAGGYERAIRFADEGVLAAQRTDNHRLLREIYATLGYALLAVPDLDGAARVAETAAGYAARAEPVSVWNLSGLVGFRQGRDEKARSAFLRAAHHLRVRNRQKGDFQLLDAEGLAHTGLALLDDVAPDDAVRAFGDARELTREAGVLAHNAFLLDLFGEGTNPAIMARVRPAAGASS